MNKFAVLSGFISILLSSSPVAAEVGSSGLPLPRFVSLRTDEANVRTGPGLQYPKKWILVKRDIPLEIISEYSDWRKIRDVQGDEGWMHKAMLTGRRTAIIKRNSTKLYSSNELKSDVRAVLENGVIVSVENCGKAFCQVSVSDAEGYIIRDNIWGVYSNENF